MKNYYSIRNVFQEAHQPSLDEAASLSAQTVLQNSHKVWVGITKAQDDHLHQINEVAKDSSDS